MILEEFSDRELLTWLAGFFDGEGSISMTIGAGYEGQVCMGQSNKNSGPLNRVLEICERLQLPLPKVFPSSNGKNTSFWWSRFKGEVLLQRLRPFLTRDRLLPRLELYVEMFDPAKKGKHRVEEKAEIYNRWLTLRENELKEV